MGKRTPAPIAERLQAVIERIDRPGTFCAWGALGAVLPGLEVEGMGPIGLPLTAAQARALWRRCEQAPYGKGTQTLVDTRVRRVWRLAPSRFAVSASRNASRQSPRPSSRIPRFSVIGDHRHPPGARTAVVPVRHGRRPARRIGSPARGPLSTRS